MEILRYSSNAWGQKTLEGLTWDLLWVFFLAGLVIMSCHAAYMWLFPPAKQRRQ